jgi:hypothetical protein
MREQRHNAHDTPLHTAETKTWQYYELSDYKVSAINEMPKLLPKGHADAESLIAVYHLH